MCTEPRQTGRHTAPLAPRRALPPRITSRRQICQRGFSLIEVVIFILVIGIALKGILEVFNLASIGSADPVLRRQSLAIAQAMLEEITIKPFGSAATDDTTQGGFNGLFTAANRPYFDDVDDYNGLTLTGISTLSNAPLTGLSRYNVSVAVASAAFGNVSSTNGYRITVTVTDPAGHSLVLDGYRANF